MEYANNGDLYQYIKKRILKAKYLNEEFIWAVFVQTV
jgi:hypothetical protein